MNARIRNKRARRFAEEIATLSVIYETARPSLWRLSPREQKDAIRFKARKVEQYMPRPLVSKETAKRVARAHYRNALEAK